MITEKTIIDAVDDWNIAFTHLMEREPSTPNVLINRDMTATELDNNWNNLLTSEVVHVPRGAFIKGMFTLGAQAGNRFFCDAIVSFIEFLTEEAGGEKEMRERLRLLRPTNPTENVELKKTFSNFIDTLAKRASGVLYDMVKAEKIEHLKEDTLARHALVEYEQTMERLDYVFPILAYAAEGREDINKIVYLIGWKWAYQHGGSTVVKHLMPAVENDYYSSEPVIFDLYDAMYDIYKELSALNAQFDELLVEYM